jgi:hypothetical protein
LAGFGTTTTAAVAAANVGKVDINSYIIRATNSSDGVMK